MEDNKKIKKKDLLVKIEELERSVDELLDKVERLQSNDAFYRAMFTVMAGSGRPKTTYTMQQTSNKPIA